MMIGLVCRRRSEHLNRTMKWHYFLCFQFSFTATSFFVFNFNEDNGTTTAPHTEQQLCVCRVLFDNNNSRRELREEKKEMKKSTRQKCMKMNEKSSNNTT